MGIDLLYNIKKSKILLWQNEHDIAFKAIDGISTEIKNDIKQHKSILLKVLAYNGIDSESKAKSILYYKIPDDIRNNVLSIMQQGIYLQSKLDKQKNTYNVPMFVFLKNIKINLLEQALFTLLKQHPILRMCDISDMFNYRILNMEEFFIPIISVDAKDIEDLYKQKSKYEFDLNSGKLINVEIISINNTNNVILNLTHHHILSDGYSEGLIISEIFAAYSNIAKKNDLMVEQISYLDYVEFQNYNLQTQEYKKAIKYLTSKLDTAELLQLKKSSLGIFDHQANSFNMAISPNVYMKLQTISKKNQVSLYSVLFTCLYHVLSNYVGEQTGFPIGINISNRTFELNKVIGPCISTLALIPEYDPKSSLINNIRQVNNEMLHLHEYHHINLNLLAKNFTRKTSKELEELMRVMFTMYNVKQNFFNISQVQHSELDYEIVNQKDDIEKFGISIDAIEQDTELYFNISYAKNLYDYDYIQLIMNSFKTFLENINEENLLQPISQIELLTNEQYRYIIHQLHNTEHKYLNNKTIHQLFEEQVNKTPDSIAVIYEDIKLTYKELNEQANRLAGYLINKYQITPDTLIPLYLDRNEHMLIAIIAVLKSGGAYVPIDTSCPNERIEYILKDIKAQLVLSNHTYNKRLANIDNNIDVICIDSTIFLKKLAMQSAFNPNSKVAASNLAYIIYTSGTTGLPKGVMIEHNGVINLKYDLTNKYSLEQNEVILQLANYVFDASIEQIILSLLNGHTLLLIKEHLWLNKEEFYCYLNKNKATHIEATPTLLEQYDFSKILSLKRIVSGGEHFSNECYKKIATGNVKKIINTYGPTETTINAVLNVVSNNLSIGTPVSNVQCYVLNKSLVPLPIGAVGELCIGGIGLARGYLNKADLTAEKFIANPFNENLRLYKTGDLVRWTSDYNLEYLGRNDSQIKIRGYRIELKEIETILSLYPGIRQTAVLAKTRSNDTAANYLIGYYVSDFKLNEEDILSYLKNKLPEYMVPSMLVYINNLPTTVNGKLDINSLPEPELRDTINYIAPSNEFELKICKIWSQVLDMPENMLSTDIDFFRLGGNSIFAMKLVHLLNNQFVCDKPISIKDLYINSTITKLSAFMQNNNLQLEEKVIFGNEVKLDQAIIPTTLAPNVYKTSNKYNVFITGGTGFIGSHLLKELIENNSVGKVFCLVVANTKNEAINKINNALNLYNLGNFNDKIIPIVGTLSKKYFGLNTEEFNRIANIVDVVIHNATFMNHLATYHALKQINVLGTEEILRFACAGRQKVVNVVSTINIFNTDLLNKMYDEDTTIDNEQHYYSNGYSSSKWVAEGLCNIARQRGINCNIYRLSLVLPNSTKPIYPKQQWFGRFIKACLDFGVFPSEFNEFETQVACVDEVAKAIISSSIDLNNLNKNFHLFSKNTLSFTSIFERMKILFNCKEVKLSDWINQYQFAKLTYNMPVISFIEDVLDLSDITSGNYQFSSEKTHNFFKKYNINFDLRNDSYIESLLNQAVVTTF